MSELQIAQASSDGQPSADPSRRVFLAGATALGLITVSGPALGEGGTAEDGPAEGKPFDREQAEKFMRRAIVLARKGVEAGDGGPFGTVIVREGKIVAEGWNRVVGAKDPTAHGEVVAIREACRRLGSFSLKGCDLYTTGEPCPMCFGAIYWARIDRVFFGFSVQDAAAAGFDDQFIYEQLAKPLAKRLVPEVQILAKEALQALKDFAANPKRVKY